MLPAPHGKGHFVPVRPDLKLHVVNSGPRNGEALIFLHGYPEFWWSWRHQIACFTQVGYHVIVPDLRGFNYSDKPPHGYDPTTLAGDIIGLMDAFGLDEATIIGHDYGGFIAYVLAQLHPERLKKFVVISAIPPDIWPTIKHSGRLTMQLLSKLGQLGHFVGAPLISRANQIVGMGRVMLWLAHEKDKFPHHIRHTFSQAYARSARTATAYVRDVTIWLQKNVPDNLTIPHPMLLMWPENDFMAPLRATQHYQKHLPNGVLVTIPNSGHWPQQEQPDFINRHILDFLRQF
jgi:pimeloyl-ACP methyl ester carboxylesterase